MKTNRDTEEYSFNHVQQRMQERHGLPIILVEYRRLNDWAMDYRGVVKIEDTADDFQTVHQLPHRGKNLLFVFSRRRNRITTVLP